MDNKKIAADNSTKQKIRQACHQRSSSKGFRIMLMITASVIIMVACGGQNNANTSETESKQASVVEVPEPKGKKLIAKSDCMACHKEKTKLIGPSYADIAAKYPSTPENIKYLANTIIKGGSGVWGNISMTAHPQMSLADAEEIAKYILTITKQTI